MLESSKEEDINYERKGYQIHFHRCNAVFAQYKEGGLDNTWTPNIIAKTFIYLDAKLQQISVW